MGGYPSVRIDASTVCQLRCPVCPTSSGHNKKGIVGWGFLKADNFIKIMEENPRISRVELSNWGEIFLNPELGRIIEYACKKNIKLTASNGSNLNTVSEVTLENMVKYKFNLLSISLDGASSETYGIYRRGGNFERVLSNIRTINSFKKKYGSEYPRLRWQFIIFGHNEHEITKARDMARELNMEFYPKLNLDSNYSPVKDKESVKRASGLRYITREDFRLKKKKEYALPCKQLWLSPQINWDGKLLGCCMNIYSDFGNVFESGLSNCINGEKYVYAKRLLMGKEKVRDDIPCIQCDIYLRSQTPVTKMF